MNTYDIVNVCAMSDAAVNRKVKIAGTSGDRHCKVTEDMRKEMQNMLERGFTYSQISQEFHIHRNTVKRNLDDEYKAAYNAYMRENFGKHTGKKTNRHDLAEYKRRLVLNDVDNIEVEI